MTWSAGFGSANITPTVPVYLAGFADRTEPAEAVHDDLEVRALWLSDGAGACCLLSFDLLALSADFAGAIRGAIAHALSVPLHAVLTSCVHTHSGPNAMAGGERLGWATPDGYREALVAAAVEAAGIARTAAAAATLWFAKAALPDGISYNRRGNPHDPWFTALDLRGADGSRIGVVANLAIHPVALGSPWLAVSSDWVGPFRAELERRGGGTALMLSGALGDVNPHERHTDLPTHIAEAHDEASDIGRAAAEAVATALQAAAPVQGDLTLASRSVRVPAEGRLADLLEISEDSVELIEWTLGDVALVGVPGEAFQALGRALEASRGGRALIAGLAPSWHGYLPMPFTEGYEETVSLGPRAVDEMTVALLGDRVP